MVALQANPKMGEPGPRGHNAGKPAVCNDDLALTATYRDSSTTQPCASHARTGCSERCVIL